MSKTVGVVIPARGGSKGIPNKNLRMLGESPLVWYPIMLAVEVGATEICVTSDSDLIMSAVRDTPARQISRPPELSGDEVVLDPVIVHAAEQMSTDIIITLLPTCPFVRSTILRQAIDAFDGRPVVASVPVHELIWDADSGEVLSGERVNRQHARNIQMESAAFSICLRASLVKAKTRYYRAPQMFPVSRIDSFDIDTPEDLAFARRIFPAFAKRGFGES